jgi:hypothetical protein
MLYVMDKRAKLGKLAHEYAELDRNRAEVCCLIGESSQSSDGVLHVLILHSQAITTRLVESIPRRSSISNGVSCSIANICRHGR